MKLRYVIKFVADMDRAVKVYRDVLGLPLKFQSPGWSEFVTIQARNHAVSPVWGPVKVPEPQKYKIAGNWLAPSYQ
jgi:catechol 2,3-dioxygenase-like lactoylglutathione lyase family enzyme